VAPSVAATKQLCEAVGQVYGDNMGKFAQALTKVPDGGGATARKDAQQALNMFADALRRATQTSDVPGAQKAGAKAADKMSATAADDAFFSSIKSADDVQKVLGPNLKSWLKPVTEKCS
jgi:hypothetical protein